MTQKLRQPLDEVDRALVRALSHDAARSNKALAAEVGVAESTCLTRVRSLRERGVITAIRAELDPAEVGRPVTAMVFVRFHQQQRAEFSRWRAHIRQLPGVVAGYHLSGSYDYLVHVATESADALRDFVLDHLTHRPGVARVDTSLVFESVQGPGLLGG